MCGIFRTVRPKNFKVAMRRIPNLKFLDLTVRKIYADGGRKPQSAASAMTSKVKGQGNKVTWYV